MGYRGDDLDLRTPQTWSAGSPGDHGWQGGGRYGTRSPIWVDETVLASANHAFEVALAHRSGEVRIEHLLYALTRIEGAAETLEKRGVRVSSLRREAATVIASDIPVSLPPGGSSVPRRSEAFEDALRLASAESQRRNAPAGVDDLVTVFLDVRPDLPGLGLLARHALRRDLGEPQPQLGRTHTYEARYAEPVVETPRERIRMPAGSYYVAEPPRPARSELAATTADTIQNSRIEALEQMVRALSHDLAGERKSFAGMLQDMQRDFVASRDDTSRLGGGLHERLQSLEHLVSSHRGGGDPQINDRLQAIERTLAAMTGDVGRQWAAASDTLKSLEQALTSRDRLAPDLTPISDRLDVIEEALLSPDAATTREVSERLASIERLVQSQRAEIIAETEVLKADVGKLAGLVQRQPAAADQMHEMVALIDRGRGDTVAAVTGPLLQRINTLTSQIETRQGESASAYGQLSERLAAAERALTLSVQRSEESHKAYAQELAELHEALMKLNSNQHTLAASIDQWRSHGASELGLVARRLEGLEKEAGKPIPMIEQMSASMEAMHRITVQRHHRRNRFWYWLFGTDDWVAASWPSQLSKLETERSMVKTVRR